MTRLRVEHPKDDTYYDKSGRAIHSRFEQNLKIRFAKKEDLHFDPL